MTEKWIIDLLNEKDKRIKELLEENERLKKENELKGDFRNFINEDIVRIKKENEQLKEELESFEQVSFTDSYDGSKTVLYMKKM